MRQIAKCTLEDHGVDTVSTFLWKCIAVEYFECIFHDRKSSSFNRKCTRNTLLQSKRIFSQVFFTCTEVLDTITFKVRLSIL
jgi:hypothetical protein